MDAWRLRLLFVTVVGSAAGYATLASRASPRELVSLGLLTGMFTLVGAGMLVVYRRQLTLNVVTSHVALGAIVHLAVGGVVLAGNRFADRGPWQELSESWMFFIAGAGGVAAALFTWSRARPRATAVSPLPTTTPDEPPPSPVKVLADDPNWAELRAELEQRRDHDGLRHLVALERLASALAQTGPAEQRVEQASLVVRQEALRLAARSTAGERAADDDDVLSQVAAFFEWGVQKLPELTKLDVPDLLLAHVVAEIRATRSRVEHVFVEHHRLQPIHPINRATAEAKADERAAAARDALELLRANGLRLSEELIAAHDELAPFRSVTGFQVVEVGPGLVTFEGNGRAAALRRAFPGGEPILVEVRQFCFDDPDAADRVRRHIDRVQRANGVRDIEPTLFADRLTDGLG